MMYPLVKELLDAYLANAIFDAHRDDPEFGRRHFSAEAPNQLWVMDVTDHRTTWIPAVVATLVRSDVDARIRIQSRDKARVLRSV